MSTGLQFARMPGSSIAAPGAVGWVTDFLNVAFYARARGERSVEDLRLAVGILTTAWERAGRRLGARDLRGFAVAYMGLRLHGSLRLDRAALMTGAERMFGPWFPGAWADPARRRHGIAFETADLAERFVCGRRLEDAALGALTPPVSPQARRQRSIHPHVDLPDPARALALLADPARWPDIGYAGGRFTALRPGGLEGQSFEIEVALEAVPRAPVFTLAT